ncbi:glycosyltransferase [Streptomyces chiangmaiensis]
MVSSLGRRRGDDASGRGGLPQRTSPPTALDQGPAQQHPRTAPGGTARTSKIVMAAGRLTRVKRYDMLIEAFTRVSPQRPDWQLRIYGSGPSRIFLQAEIDRRNMAEHIQLMGPATPLAPKWDEASIAAVTSAQESFGMTLVEAMGHGLPVVSTDCPHGPREIIRHGIDGRLVPRDDIAALSRALAQLMDDQPMRETMGQAARARAQACFTPKQVAGRYEELLTDLQRHFPADTQTGRRDLLSPLYVGRATLGITARGAYRRLRRYLHAAHALTQNTHTSVRDPHAR